MHRKLRIGQNSVTTAVAVNLCYEPSTFHLTQIEVMHLK